MAITRGGTARGVGLCSLKKILSVAHGGFLLLWESDFCKQLRIWDRAKSLIIWRLYPSWAPSYGACPLKSVGTQLLAAPPVCG